MSTLLAVLALVGGCRTMHVTGYVRTELSAFTADGTPVTTDEPIAAATAFPLGTRIRVTGLGEYRVADRGLLGPRDLDIAVWTRSEAFALTGEYEVCTEEDET